MILKLSLSEQIYETIKQDILKQKIGFGEKLVNRDLREKFGVSSTPVRDAINRLYQDGLLEDISNGGARVISFDYQMAVDINEIVSILSSAAVKLSYQNGQALKIIPTLRQYVDLQKEYINSEEYFSYDMLFHETFFNYCGNWRYKQLYKQYQSLWYILVKFYHRDQDSTRSHATSQHQQILEAYEQGDILLAQQHLELHYLDAVRPFRNTLKNLDSAENVKEN